MASQGTRPGGLLGLPDDIILGVIDFSDFEDIKTLREVHSRFAQITTKRLFSTIVLRPNQSSADWILDLVNSPAKISPNREQNISTMAFHLTSPDYRPVLFGGLPSFAAAAFTPAMPNLEKVRRVTIASYDNDELLLPDPTGAWVSLLPDVFTLISFLPNKPEELQILAGKSKRYHLSVETFPPESTSSNIWSTGLLSVLSDLRVLNLVLYDRLASGGRVSDSGSLFSLLKLVAPNIERIRIALITHNTARSSGNVGSAVCMWHFAYGRTDFGSLFRRTTFPNLRELVLHNIKYAPEDLGSFLYAHGDRLHKVTLSQYHCRRAVPSFKDIDVLASTAGSMIGNLTLQHLSWTERYPCSPDLLHRDRAPDNELQHSSQPRAWKTNAETLMRAYESGLSENAVLHGMAYEQQSNTRRAPPSPRSYCDSHRSWQGLLEGGHRGAEYGMPSPFSPPRFDKDVRRARITANLLERYCDLYNDLNPGGDRCYHEYSEQR